MPTVAMNTSLQCHAWLGANNTIQCSVTTKHTDTARGWWGREGGESKGREGGSDDARQAESVSGGREGWQG